jgi:hypothetical protein
LRIVVPLLAGAMFFLELTIAPMYAIPMDVSKEFAGLGSAYVIMGVGLAGIVSPVVFGWLIELTGNWNVPLLNLRAIGQMGDAYGGKLSLHHRRRNAYREGGRSFGPRSLALHL